ncbi:hypothetical protein HanHA300_Chr16g0606461 [Helianthus annuus]|nr:hypothetical protein HanHA300_Chr16g0606461 [Helianthus annuus]KAJ0460133.1 hypothetical protein HanHA89_Chr16g0657041 [Helianthus annuus]
MKYALQEIKYGSGALEFQVMLSIKMSSMVFGFGQCVFILDETRLPNLDYNYYL